MMKRRVARYMLSTECPVCHGKRLRRESLSVTFAGLDITEISRLPLAKLAALLRPHAESANAGLARMNKDHPEKAIVAQRIAEDIETRLAVLLDLGNQVLRLADDFRVDVDHSVGELRMALGHDAVLL